MYTISLTKLLAGVICINGVTAYFVRRKYQKELEHYYKVTAYLISLLGPEEFETLKLELALRLDYKED